MKKRGKKKRKKKKKKRKKCEKDPGLGFFGGLVS
jgi:hypothetical protein